MAMFDQTFVDGVGKTNKGWTVVLSFGLQFLIVAVLILIPLIYTDVLPQAPVDQHVDRPSAAASAPSASSSDTGRKDHQGGAAPVRRRPADGAARNSEKCRDHRRGSQRRPAERVAGAAAFPAVSRAALARSRWPGRSAAAAASSASGESGRDPPEPLKVGGNVQAANLLKKITPAYPALAKSARIQGTVRFTAIIGKDGTIQNLQLVSGHPMLVQSATEAVKQWVYKPTLLNGEPVEVITQIDVNFTLSQ